MTNANELTHATTISPSRKPNLTMLACVLGLIILVVMYAKIIGF
jgi:hypothetical protein